MYNAVNLKIEDALGQCYNTHHKINGTPLSVLIGYGPGPSEKYHETDLHMDFESVELPGPYLLVAAPMPGLSSLDLSDGQASFDLLLRIEDRTIKAASTWSHESWYADGTQLSSYLSIEDLYGLGSIASLVRLGAGSLVRLSAHISDWEKEIAKPSDYSGPLEDIASVHFPGKWLSGNRLDSPPKIETRHGTYTITAKTLSQDECRHLIDMCGYARESSQDPGIKSLMNRTATIIQLYGGLK